MSAAAAARGTPRTLRIGASEPTLPLASSRGAAFLLLAAFGSLHWMAMLQPAEPGRAWAVVGVAALALGALLAAARLDGWRRPLAAVAAMVPLLALALLAGGVAGHLLAPRAWGELSSGVSRGIESLPGVRVPYEGIDPWTRAVIALGGSILALLAAALAFWPRSRGRTGHPLTALIALVLLYVVPAVALDFRGEFLRGAILALLVLAFLRLEKLKTGDVRAAAAIAVTAALAALIVAPALDRSAPWWDYESWALEAASSKTTAYSWDHSYGPLNWPRDGRELLRVRARFAAYWKAENLNAFDGLHWRRDDPTTILDELPDRRSSLARWSQTIRVSVRNLRSDMFVAAGYAAAIPSANVRALPTLDGGYTAARMLHRGDTYTARVYTPQPTQRQRETAGVGYPADLIRYRALNIPRGADPRLGLATVTFPAWGTQLGNLRAAPPHGGSAASIVALLEHSYYARAWALSQRLRSGASMPEEYVQRVLAYLGKGFSYTETPPRSAQNLEGFLFESRTGYCQQFSGAMALLLRMGGVPARVATGFTSGSFDRKANEYVVRDLDAHSWVEVWYPGYGWVTFDPTPAVAPPRSQPDEATGGGSSSGGRRPPSFSGDVPALRGGATAQDGGGLPWFVVVLLTVAALAVVCVTAALVARRRRRGPLPAVQELERALRRTRRPLPPGTTLRALEDAFHSAAAAGYVRALREERYSGRPARPTGAQRRGLRSELARGGGFRGRLRAWWALPPGVR